MIDLIERDACTPHAVIDLRHPANHRLSRLIKTDKERVILDISRRAIARRHIGSRHLTGRTRLNQCPVDLKIPIVSVLSVFAREHKVGWKL